MPYSEPPTLPPSGPGPTAPEWNSYVLGNLGFLARPPAARVYNTGLQDTISGADTFLTFNAVRFDTDNMWNGGSRLVCKTPGFYQIQACLAFASNPSGVRQLGLVLNGTTGIGVIKAHAVNGETHGLTVVATYPLVIGDYVEVDARQTSGGVLAVVALGNFSPEFSAAWIGLG